MKYKIGDFVRFYSYEELKNKAITLRKSSLRTNRDIWENENLIKGFYLPNSNRWVRESWLGNICKIIDIKQNDDDYDYYFIDAGKDSYFSYGTSRECPHWTSDEYFELYSSTKTMETE